MMLSPEVARAVNIVEMYELSNGRGSYQEATRIFKEMADPTSSLEKMQDAYYAILGELKKNGFDGQVVSAVGAVITWAWDGVGEWRA